MLEDPRQHLECGELNFILWLKTSASYPHGPLWGQFPTERHTYENFSIYTRNTSVLHQGLRESCLPPLVVLSSTRVRITLKMGQVHLESRVVLPLSCGGWVSVFNHNTTAFGTASREFGAEEFTRGSWETRRQRKMSMGHQVKCKNQCSTLILQEALRALRLPVSYMLWFSPRKATEGALC